jgi:thiosulfate/3-mercaptopyruvate sulfurtransferase
MDVGNAALPKLGDEVWGIVQAQGATPDKLIICWCRTGREVTNKCILLRHFLGYARVKSYEGSFTEWTSYPDSPVVTGPNPRQRLCKLMRRRWARRCRMLGVEREALQREDL